MFICIRNSICDIMNIKGKITFVMSSPIECNLEYEVDSIESAVLILEIIHNRIKNIQNNSV
jgi:hypothetical protein